MGQPRARRAAPPPSKTLEDLRPLLVGPEQRRIRRLEERLDQHMTGMVADVLPEAVIESRKQGEALSWAMEPLLSSAIHESVRRDPAAFADAISPAMGPALRRSVACILRTMIERLNQALEQSLSPRSVRWRLEAWRTGRPFAEVVLLRTMVYRTEQLFLVHRGTGIVLEHLSAEDIPVRDPDQISAMLAAIDAFAHDAFRAEARLEQFRAGDLTGWVEQGPMALLVAIVRGVAPQEYEIHLCETLEHVHLLYGRELADFRGDPAPFSGSRDLLARCLRQQRKEAARRGRAARAAAVLAVVGLATALGVWAHASRRDQRRLAEAVEALRSEPGIVVISAERRAGEAVLTGLRDPLAADPRAVIERGGLARSAVTLRFEPFYSVAPQIVARRVERALRPPPGVSLARRGGTLVASGVAPERWIERARVAAALLPGVEALDDGRLHAEESIARARAAASAIEQAELLFDRGAAEVAAGQRARVAEVAAAARQLFARAPEAGMAAEIRVIGHADPVGTEALNRALSLARAERVAAELVALGVPADRLRPIGAGVRRARSVTFAVDLRAAEAD
ncbi:membrane protein [Sorangium cellulosum]|uniref:Membrane protein n=1 Tax=Sorangium cellulosum TaxID=56 RepID=A0A4V0NE29_SORCE|nr:OmpA family protein [Sorangium cellulosum]AUX24732.1 membrane protein [Sorangium cellulosum]